MVVSGYGRISWLFWLFTLLGRRRSSLAFSRSRRGRCPSLTTSSMDSLLLILSLPSSWPTSTKPPTYLLTTRKRLLGGTRARGSPLMSYRSFPPNLFRESHLRLSRAMAYSTCSAFGVSEGSAPCFRGSETFLHNESLYSIAHMQASEICLSFFYQIGER